MSTQFESEDGQIIITKLWSFGEFHYEVNVGAQQIRVDADELLEIAKLIETVFGGKKNDT